MVFHKGSSPGHASYNRCCSLCSRITTQKGGKYLNGRGMGLWACAACLADREARRQEREAANDLQSPVG